MSWRAPENWPQTRRLALEAKKKVLKPDMETTVVLLSSEVGGAVADQ